MTVGVKLLLFTHNSGPVDTTRLALVGQLELPTGIDAYSSDSVDPIVGIAFTTVRGRHGVNASAKWKFNTGEHPFEDLAGMGDADALFYDASYLFRVLPARYGADSSDSALYLVLEANGVYETNGDDRILLSPGLLFEAKNFAVEFAVQLPLRQDLDERPRVDFGVTLGFRFLF